MSNWYSKTKDHTILELETNERHGLTEDMVQIRLKNMVEMNSSPNKDGLYGNVFSPKLMMFSSMFF